MVNLRVLIRDDKIMNHELIKSVEHLLAKGNKAMADKDFIQAIKHFDEGLEIIGNNYDMDGMEDSTGRKLTLANTFQKQDKLEDAANLKQRILTTRFEVFKQKYGYE